MYGSSRCPETVPIPSSAGELALSALGVTPDKFQAPLGLVILFGAGNKVFSPGAGYGVRFAMEDAYREGAGLPFPALPGLLTPGLVSTSDSGISYGLFAKADPNTPNFAKNRLNENGENLYELAYGRVEDDTMVVPFMRPPSLVCSMLRSNLSPQAASNTRPISWSVMVMASVMDVAYRLRGEKTGLLTGKALDEKSLSPVAGASVLVYDADDRPSTNATRMLVKLGARCPLVSTRHESSSTVTVSTRLLRNRGRGGGAHRSVGANRGSDRRHSPRWSRTALAR